MSPHCKSCGAEIEFVEMESGKKNPVNIPNPTWSAMMGETVVVKIHGRPGFVMKVPDDGKPLIEVFTSHFVTCPSAAQHRRKK
jgi:hypothetical protein